MACLDTCSQLVGPLCGNATFSKIVTPLIVLLGFWSWRHAGSVFCRHFSDFFGGSRGGAFQGSFLIDFGLHFDVIFDQKRCKKISKKGIEKESQKVAKKLELGGPRREGQRRRRLSEQLLGPT